MYISFKTLKTLKNYAVMLHLLCDIILMLILYSWRTFRLLSPMLSGWISIMTVKVYWYNLFHEASLLLLCNLSFMYADYVVFVTLYVRRDSCLLLYARVGCCLLYPRCTGFASDFFFLVALFWFPCYTELYLRRFRVWLTSRLWRSVNSSCEQALTGRTHTTS